MQFSLDKEKAAELGKKLNINVSFDNNTSGVTVFTDGKRMDFDFEDFFPELRQKEDFITKDQDVFFVKAPVQKTSTIIVMVSSEQSISSSSSKKLTGAAWGEWKMSAILQFRNYHVIESHYKFNPYTRENENEDEADNRILPKIFYKLETNPNSIEEAIIYLGIELGDPTVNSPNFYVKVRIAGFFEIVQNTREMTEEEILGFYKVNAIAILFPYLRGIVSDISSKGSEGPIILPTMNIVSMIEENHFKEDWKE